jgi:hypothetical protein
MSVLIILMLIAATVALYVMKSGETLRFDAHGAADNVIMAAVGIVGGKRRWQLTSQTERGASFQYRKGPNPVAALILLLCFIIPGILYVVLAGKRESLVVNVGSDPHGNTLVQITSNGFRGKSLGRAVQRRVGALRVSAAVGVPELTH